MLNIYDIAGNTLLSVPETEGCEHVAELMNADYVKLSFALATGDTLPQGAYVVYKGETYRLFEPYTPARSNEVEYKYEPKFHSKVMGWTYKPFFFLQTDSGVVVRRESDWSLTGTIADFLNRIVASIADEAGEAYSFDYDLSLIGSKSIQFQAVDIVEGLNMIAEAWDTEWWVSSTVIHLSRCAHSTAVALTVGTNVGVPTVTRNDEGYYTRFYAFGSTRNIPQDYTSGSSASHVVQRRLTLPVATCPNGYKDIREGMTPVEINSKVLIFDHIYPKSALTISSVRYETRYRYDADGNRIQIGTEPGGDPIYETYRVYFFQIAGYTFDLESIIEGKTLSVHFETGNLAGWEYELSYRPEEDEFEIIIDESTGYILPNELLAPTVDDQIVLFNISMPSEYTASAEEELEEALDEEIERLTSDVSTYQVNSYPVQFASSGISLTVGRNVNFTNGSSFLATRVLSITEKLDEPYTVSIRLGEKITKKTTKRLQEEIVDVNKSVEAVATRLLNVSRAWRNYRSSSEILDMIFDADGYFDGTKIRPESIETMMLRVGSRSQQLSFNSVIEPNYGGDPNSIHISAGSLANYGIADTVQNWNIGASTYTLVSTGAYYIYARCSKSDAAGIVILSQEQITVDEDEDYYHFLLGILHSVDSGVRWISLTYGSTSINGRFIRTGRIISQDNLNYFDLDENKFRVGDTNSGLDWNDTAEGTLTLKGALVQSKSGVIAPISCFRGIYNGETLYYKGDTVTFGGSSWLYINDIPTTGNEPEIANNFGALYNWHAVNDGRQIAAEDWRVPSIEDWRDLKNTIGGCAEAGKKLKALSLAYWAASNNQGNNLLKFNAVGSGRRNYLNGLFNHKQMSCGFWTSTEMDDDNAHVIMLHFNHPMLIGDPEDAETGKYLSFGPTSQTVRYQRLTIDSLAGTVASSSILKTIGDTESRSEMPSVIVLPNPEFISGGIDYPEGEYDFNPGIVGSEQIIRYGTAPSVLNFLTPPSGGSAPYTFRWQRTNNLTTIAGFADITGATSGNVSYSPPVLGKTAMFRCKVTDSNGLVAYTNEVVIYVMKDLSAGRVNASQVLLANDIPDPIIETENATGGSTVYTYQWQERINDAGVYQTVLPVFGQNKRWGFSLRLVREAIDLEDGEEGVYIGNDGTVYGTICIGDKEWLSENLSERRFRNGDLIQEVTNNAEWGTLTTAGLCAYENDWNNVIGSPYWLNIAQGGKTGFDGNYIEFRYAKNGSTITPPSIVNTDLNPSGWSTTPPATGALEYLWMTQAYKSANGTLLISNWTYPVRIKGEKGESGAGTAGPAGPIATFQGNYSGDKTYFGNASRIDIAKYGDVYYRTRVDAPGGSFSGVLPTNTDYWESFGANFESIATGLLFSELAFVENLGVRVLKGSPVPVGDLAGTVTNITPNISPEPEWDPDTYYNVDDKCSDSGINYVCLIANIGVPLNLPYWSTSTPQPQKRKDRIRLSGTSGSANITSDGITRKIDYSSGGIEQTAADFVVLYAADWLAGGVVLTSVGEDLFFESLVAGQNFTGNTTITNEPNFYRGSIIVRGNEIWEDNEDNDLYGVIAINRRGYHGGHTRNRATLIGDGKGKTILCVTPIDAGGMFKGLNLVNGMPLRLAQMGTAQINELTGREGTLAYDMNTHSLKVFTNNGWKTVQTS